MMFWKRMLPTSLMFLMAFGALGATASGAVSRQPTPPRLGFIDGDVSFWRPGADDWVRAQVNTALAAGDSLYAGDGANLEIQIGPRAFVRAGANTEIGLESLDPDYMQFRVTGGHAALDLKRLRNGQVVEIDTPNGAFTIDRAGYYHVHVDEGTTVFSARRGGAASLIAAGGGFADVEENQQVVLEGTDITRVAVNAAPDLDQWDRWNYDRINQYGDAPRSAQYLPPDIAGVDDLDRYGDWRESPDYGHVWVPRDVAPDWAPYSTGRWVYDPYYEWTWVDEAPWGWAPYHYGRWAHTGGYWGWVPGPVVVAPVYAPALVAFFGHGGVSVSIGSPFVSWVALGFGEPVIPWWGGRGFAGTPYWGGWGGQRVVNNVAVSNTTIVNVNNINIYNNAGVNNAVIATDRDQFGRGQKHTRLAQDRVKSLQPVRGDLQVKPVAASLALSETRGSRPPDKFRKRSVVATRQPQDATKPLERKGLRVAPEANRPAPRIVERRRGGSEAASSGERGGPGDKKTRGTLGAAEQQPPAPPARREVSKEAEAGKPERAGRPPRADERLQPGTAAREPAAPPSAEKGERQPRNSRGEAARVAPPVPKGKQDRPGRQRPGIEEGRTSPLPPPQGGGREQPAASDARERSKQDVERTRRSARPPSGERSGGGPAAERRDDPGSGAAKDRAVSRPPAGGSDQNDRSRDRVPPPSGRNPANNNPPVRAEKPQRHPDASAPPVAEVPAAPQPNNVPRPGERGKKQKDKKDQTDTR